MWKVNVLYAQHISQKVPRNFCIQLSAEQLCKEIGCNKAAFTDAKKQTGVMGIFFLYFIVLSRYNTS